MSIIDHLRERFAITGLGFPTTILGTLLSSEPRYNVYFKVDYLLEGRKCTQYIECKRITQCEIDRICVLRGKELGDWVFTHIAKRLNIIGTIGIETKSEI